MPNLFDYTPQDAAQDASYTLGRNPYYDGGRGGSYSIGQIAEVNRTGFSRNADPFTQGINPKTAYETRKQAKRIYAPAAGALAAQNQLLQPQAELAGRGADLFGSLYRRESDRSREHQVRQNLDSDPAGANLLSLLTGDATSLVGRGADAYEDPLLVDSVRGADAARGLAYGPSSVLRETLSLDRARDNRRMARGQYGAGILGLREGYLDRDVAMPGGSNIMSPVNPTGTEDLFSWNVNDQISRRNDKAARKASQMALIGSAIEAVGSIAGGAAACWVAEELYGKDDARTHLARAYVARQPVEGFYADYAQHGQDWAAYLKANPALKPLVQWKWDAMWREQQRWLSHPDRRSRGDEAQTMEPAERPTSNFERSTLKVQRSTFDVQPACALVGAMIGLMTTAPMSGPFVRPSTLNPQPST